MSVGPVSFRLDIRWKIVGSPVLPLTVLLCNMVLGGPYLDHGPPGFAVGAVGPRWAFFAGKNPSGAGPGRGRNVFSDGRNGWNALLVLPPSHALARIGAEGIFSQTRHSTTTKSKISPAKVMAMEGTLTAHPDTALSH